MPSGKPENMMTPAPMKVFIVEDDTQIATQIKTILSNAGFECHVALSAANFLGQLATTTPHLCIVDLGLPDFDGMDLIGEIKARTQAGILILSGRSHIRDKVSGLETGADDYMVKPFDSAELVARVRSILRRNQLQPAPLKAKEIAVFKGWRFNLSNNTITSERQQKTTLTTAEAELLKVFVKNPNRILQRERLVGHRDLAPTDRSVDIRISRLRKKLESGEPHLEIIKTVYGAGYIFLAQIEWIHDDNA